jgi:YD repeat-containing protein
MGNLVSVTKPLSGSTTYSNYDELGHVGQMTDSYDTRGRITQVDRGGAITQYQYYSTGKLRTSTGPAGEVLSYSYDDAQRLIEISDNQGNRMVYTLNTGR